MKIDLFKKMFIQTENFISKYIDNPLIIFVCLITFIGSSGSLLSKVLQKEFSLDRVLVFLLCGFVSTWLLKIKDKKRQAEQEKWDKIKADFEKRKENEKI